MISAIDNIINIVDLIVLGIFIRSIYIGFKEGILVELFKLVGIFFATFFTLHYFAGLGEILSNILPLPADMVLVISYVLIWVLSVVIFSFVRQGWMLGFPPVEKTIFLKVAGGVAGGFRAIFVSGLLFIALFMTGQNVIANSARKSYTGFYLKDISVSVYQFCFDHFVAPVFPKEPFNKKVLEYSSQMPKPSE
jgi:uncharacterized membrane protein required for colicin V production